MLLPALHSTRLPLAIEEIIWMQWRRRTGTQDIRGKHECSHGSDSAPLIPGRSSIPIAIGKIAFFDAGCPECESSQTSHFISEFRPSQNRALRSRIRSRFQRGPTVKVGSQSKCIQLPERQMREIVVRLTPSLHDHCPWPAADRISRDQSQAWFRIDILNRHWPWNFPYISFFRVRNCYRAGQHEGGPMREIGRAHV
jgi:hypothetical protein